ncbi:pyridoxal 5'-phosphate synthase glutaminase subunit PdxT [Chloroflexota bacterium]
MNRSSMLIGVLALQGSFSEHVEAFGKMAIPAVEVRHASELAPIDGLVMPGGESTTILKLLDEFGIREPLIARIRGGLPILATCAGTVCLARKILSHDMSPLGVLDITVERNGFGRQVESFEEDLVIEGLQGDVFRGVFIRAPLIERCDGDARVLARLSDGTIAACREGNLIATAFHPEFVNDRRMHQYFVDCVRTWKTSQSDIMKSAAATGASQ